MLQTLFHIPHHIGSLPVFGFGLLLTVWIVFSVCLLGWLAWRQGFNADTWGYVPLLAIVAAVIAWLLPGLCDPEGLPIRGYGVMILTAVVAATSLALWRAKRLGLDPEMLFSLAFWLCLPGIVGARLFYVVQNWSDQFWVVYLDTKSPLALVIAVVNVAQGGLVVYGSLFGGLLGLVLFCRKHRVPLLATADLIAPSLALGLALGRLGCLMNGCCYGGLCELPWALSFPAGSPPYYSQIARGVFYGLVLSEEPTAPATVLSVDGHSAAGQVALHPGDRLTEINGVPVRTAGDAHVIFARLFKEHSPVVLRLADGRTLSLPPAVPPARSLRVHPTQLYASIGGFLICLLLLAYDPFYRRDGALFALMLTVYPVERFLEEALRTDETSVWGTGLHISQNISLAMLVGVAMLWVYILRQPRGRAFGTPSAA